VHTIHDIIVKK